MQRRAGSSMVWQQLMWAGQMRQSWFIVGHALWGSVAGGLLAISTPFFFALAGALWLSVLIELVRAQPVGQRWRRGLAMVSVQGVALAAVITAAALAPVKTQDRLQELPVVLPKTELTLGELKELTETGQLRVPTLLSISFPEAEAATVVRWPTQDLTLRRFIAAIEEQTRLRHQFWSCGNGLTILWGSDAAFGLSLRDPDQRLGP